MVWQDIVIALANVILGYSLIYQVYFGFKKKKGFITLQTSTLSVIGLFLISFAFFTLGLYFSAFIAFLNGSLWFILFIQGLIYKKV